jgi:hypothetical protein
LYISCAWKNALVLGYISPFPYTIWHKGRYQKIPKTFSYCAHTITNLIIQSSLESHTLEFFAYHLPYLRSRCLVTWQREVKLCKVSEDTRVVGKSLRNFWYLTLGQVVKYTPKPCARSTQLLALNKSELSGLWTKFSRRATISQLFSEKRGDDCIDVIYDFVDSS